MENVIQIGFPKSLAHSLKLTSDDFVTEIKISSMVKLYELGKVSSGVASKVLGFSRIEFFELLSKYHVSVLGNHEIEDLSEEIANA